MAKAKNNKPGLSAKDKSGLFHYKRRTPSVLLNYVDKKELWITIGKNDSRYFEVVDKVEEAMVISELEYINEDIKKKLILDLVGIEEFNTNALSIKQEDEETKLLSYSMNTFLKKKEANQNPGKTLTQYKAYFEVCKTIIGDINIDTIEDSHIESIKDILNVMPSRGGAKYRGISIEEMVSTTASVKDRLNVTTKNKYLKAFKAVLDHYNSKKGNREYEVPDFELFTDKRDSRKLRNSFNNEEITELNTGEDIFNKISRVYSYTGARLTELKVGTLRKEEGVDVLSLQFNDTDTLVKNTSSLRFIPIHDSIKNDIMEVKALLEKHSTDWLSKLFNNELRRRGFGKHYTMYSLRHTFANKMKRNGIESDITKTLMGHRLEGMLHGVYAEPYSVEQLKEAIDTL